MTHRRKNKYCYAMLTNKTVVLGVTGGIAAYKSAALASLLIKNHADVQVIMTENAVKFISPLTFETLTKHKCLIDTFDRNFEYTVGHVSVAQKADIFVIAPATANTIAKLAHGFADNMLTTTFLAARCPKLIVPAMNTAMLENPATQKNLALCAEQGMRILDTVSGRLACGDTGKGKMLDPEDILCHIVNEIGRTRELSGKRILITAGPTQEPIDPVRYITNHSTGKMGYALAEEASARGADVTLISGPVALKAPAFVKTIRVTTAAEMFAAVKNEYSGNDIIIKAAAVADYRPKTCSAEKIKKTDGDSAIQLERTDDILRYLGEHKQPGQFLCGFSMETERTVEHSRAKLERKHADMIVANNLKTPGAGFGTDTNVVTILTRDSETELPLLSKRETASRILDKISEETARS